jgi:hypothetical protein
MKSDSNQGIGKHNCEMRIDPQYNNFTSKNSNDEMQKAAGTLS